MGKTLSEVASDKGKSVVETLVDFALAGDEELPHGVQFRPVAGHVFDVENYMRQEFTATSTDGGVQLGEAPPGRHPRYWGTYPRKLAYYVRERGVITLPFAIRSSTGLPAQIIALPDRGYLREGYKADIVVFDFERVQDHATILEPGRPPEGIEYVLVNGELAVERGQLTGALAGVVIDRTKVRPDGSSSTEDP